MAPGNDVRRNKIDNPILTIDIKSWHFQFRNRTIYQGYQTFGLLRYIHRQSGVNDSNYT
jgi:hypothetical protein